MGNPFEAGGGGMWILLGYLAVFLPLIWGFGIVQLVALIRWKRMAAELGRFAGEKDAEGLAGHLDGKAGRGVMGDVLAAAAGATIKGEDPPVVMDRARSDVERRMSATPPARAVLCVLALALGPLAPLALSTYLRYSGIIWGWGVATEINPHQRCQLLEVAMERANYPFWLGVAVCAVLAVPALVALFLQLGALGARRRRDDVLRLVESLVGRPPRPVTGAASGSLAFVCAVVLTAAAAWILTGPPARNLAAPRLHAGCVLALEYWDVHVPVHSDTPSGVEGDLTIIVTRSDIVIEEIVFNDMVVRTDVPPVAFESRRVTDLVDGRLGAALGSDGMTVEPLATALDDVAKRAQSMCTLPDCSTWGVDSILAIIADDVPAETSAAVIATARGSGDRSVFVLVRTEPPPAEPPTLAVMIEDVKGFASMKCVGTCPYGVIEIDDAAGLPRDGTFGSFVQGI